MADAANRPFLRGSRPCSTFLDTDNQEEGYKDHYLQGNTKANTEDEQIAQSSHLNHLTNISTAYGDSKGCRLYVAGSPFEQELRSDLDSDTPASACVFLSQRVTFVRD